MSDTPIVTEIDVLATHDLRARVLRVGTTSSLVDFPEDAFEDTFHLGVEFGGVLIAISTWIIRQHPDHPSRRGLQLRGMATDPSPNVRGRGFGSMLLLAGLDRARAAGTDIVWANARTTVVDFYRAHGFTVEEPDFISADTGLPHHRVYIDIS